MSTHIPATPDDGVAQSRLQHFMVSLWLHFFQQRTTNPDIPWKECSRRRRQNFFDAQRNEAMHFADCIASRSPDCQRAQLAAVVNSRLEQCQPLSSRPGEICNPPTDPTPH